jgi:LysM repeat protein
MVERINGSGSGYSSSTNGIASADEPVVEDTPTSTSDSTDGTLVAWAPSLPFAAPQAPVMTPGGYSNSGSSSTPSPSETRSSSPTADPFGVESNTGSSNSGSTSSTATTNSVLTPGTPASGGTHVFNNLAGRDPDLLYAGETIKIEVNGKVINHVVKPGETLSSIAAANGVSVASLIKTNGMDNNLLGKNSAGNYFVSGGPQPAPGSASLTSHAGSTSTSSPDATPPVPDTTTELQPNTHLGTADISQPHSKDTLEITLANIGRMENSTDQNVKPSAEESKAWRDLVGRALRGDKLSETDEKELVRIEKYVHDTIGPQRSLAPTPQAVIG